MTYRVVRGGLPITDHLGEVVFEPRDGALEDREVELDVADSRGPTLNLFGGQGLDELRHVVVPPALRDAVALGERNNFA